MKSVYESNDVNQQIELSEALSRLKKQFGAQQVMDTMFRENDFDTPAFTPYVLEYLARTSRMAGLALVKRTANLSPEGVKRLDEIFGSIPLVYENAPESIQGLIDFLPKNPIDIVDGRIITSEPSIYSLHVETIERALEIYQSRLKSINEYLSDFDRMSKLQRWLQKKWFRHGLQERATLKRRIGKFELLKSHFNLMAEIEGKHYIGRVVDMQNLVNALIKRPVTDENRQIEPELDAFLARHNLRYDEESK
ncbi:hypothetical protein [Alteromonas sp. BZK5]|uniref:hypothetical protein n=1 Tax=Alteromonas sp. BZK5 TaxID=1904459 RepID=UPI001653A33C|nr:hypothetical protein [Alteromonas sp. BZK5]MBC6987654.1 hypothetical protein [Alteromonas sp. BZK5]